MVVAKDALAEVVRFCQERTPPDHRDQMRLECTMRGDAITIVERRAPWNPRRGSDWTTSDVAQLRHDGAEGTWSLHWRGSDDRWHAYKRIKPGRSVTRLLAEIDADPTGIFWAEAARLARVDRRAIARLRDGLPGVARCGEPRFLRLLHLGERLFGGRAERRARFQVGDVGDVAAVLLAVENVDVVVAQRRSSMRKAYLSTNRRNAGSGTASLARAPLGGSPTRERRDGRNT